MSIWNKSETVNFDEYADLYGEIDMNDLNATQEHMPDETIEKEISVIIPCYNVEKWVDRCLKSVMDQTVGTGRIEVICVDDCSTDGTLNKLLGWENKYPETFIIVQSPANGRQGQARNIGLEYANTDWIAFLDSDDWIEPAYLERLYRCAASGNYDLVCCKEVRDNSRELTYLQNTGDGTKYEIIIRSADDRRKQIINPELKYNAWGKLIKKSFIYENELFFLPNLTYEDALWGSLVELYFSSACIIDEALYHYFVNEDSTVLSKNANHHLDCITVQMNAWREYEVRGLLDEYYYELQVEQIYSGYLAALKAIILRYSVPDYNVYLLLREIMADRLRDYKENPYIVNGLLSEVYMLMMTTLDKQLNKEEFQEFATYIKKVGI